MNIGICTPCRSEAQPKNGCVNEDMRLYAVTRRPARK